MFHSRDELTSHNDRYVACMDAFTSETAMADHLDAYLGSQISLDEQHNKVKLTARLHQ